MKFLKKLILLLIILTAPGGGNAVLLIDDFNDGDNITYQNELIGSYAGGGGGISYSIDSSKALGNSGYALKISYSGCDISGGGYAGISVPLDTSVNYIKYHYISFFIKGDASAVGDNIIAGYNDGANRFVNISAYLPEHKITTNWQKVVIPIDGLGTNFSSPSTLNFVSEWKYNSGSGTIYIDNIMLGTNIPGRIIIDSFYNTNSANDMYADNNVYYDDLYSYSVEHLTADFNIFPYGLKFNFSISNSGWVIYMISFVNTRNCSIYSNLVFNAKGVPVVGTFSDVKIEINHWSHAQFLSAFGGTYFLSDTWKKFTLPLGNFPNLTNSQLNYVGFVCDKNSGTTNGSLYLDDIAFEIKDYTPDTNAPSVPSNIQVSGIDISNHFVFNSTNGSVISAVCDSRSNDSSIECVRFEYRLVNTDKWIFIAEDYSVSNSLYKTSLWNPPFEKVFDVRVSAIDIFGNESSSAIFYHCYTGSIFVKSRTILNDEGGWLRDTDFSYIDIPAQSFNDSELSFSLSKSYNGKSVYDFASSTGSGISFYGYGIVLGPSGVYFNKNISVSLPVPDLPAGVSAQNLSVYYWDDGAWIELPSEDVYDEFGNRMLKCSFDRSGVFIIGTKSNNNISSAFYTEDISEFYMSEKILTPNNDGQNDLLTVSFNTKLNNNSEITFKLINLNGDVVYEKSINPVNNRVVFSWDGKNDFNNYVSPGVYILFVKTPGKSLKNSITVIK